MPTFLNFFTATIYAQSAVYDGKNGGWSFPALYQSPSYQAFSKSGIKLYAVSPAQSITNNGVAVTINSIIEVLPSGVLGALGGTKYASDSTFTNLYNQGA